ncbi:3-dehydroquinate synthase [Bacteroidota bacterium]
MKKINIPLSHKPYNVFIGENIFPNLLERIKKQNLKGNLFFIIDKKVYSLYKNQITNLFDSSDERIYHIILRADEASKSFTSLQKIFRKMLSLKLGRDSVIITLGGGIIGDIAGFAASNFMRGVSYVQVPTTLLSAVDSSVGGKTGINFYDTKNVIGSFYQPEFVMIDTSFFDTLPEEELLCGIGEIVKYAFLSNKKFFGDVKNNIDNIYFRERKTLNRIISESVKLKSGVVIQDEREKDLRKILNLGHTFAHAFEVEQNYKIKHGHAVIVGISCALYLSKRLGILADEKLKYCLTLLRKFEGQIKIKAVDKRKVYSIMFRDKKNRDGKIKFVLLKDVGEIIVDVQASKDDIYYSLSEGIKLFQH